MGAYVSEVMFWLYRPLTFMLWGGVFERFPRLKAMVVEGGTMFMVPSWLMLLDHNYTDVQFSAKLVISVHIYRWRLANISRATAASVHHVCHAVT